MIASSTAMESTPFEAWPFDEAWPLQAWPFEAWPLAARGSLQEEEEVAPFHGAACGIAASMHLGPG